MTATLPEPVRMNDNHDEPDDKKANKLLTFPQSRTRPRREKQQRDLGLSKMAQRLRGVQPGLKGHWCSRCHGIWYGYVGEVECPVCGNRNG